jgi:equilibrative nucleoside transporter 1/2/3
MSHTVEGGNQGEEVALIGQTEAEEIQRTLERAVEDSNIVHWIFFILGCAVLLPWNGMSASSCPRSILT